jgi:hypothetical protein
MDADDKISTFRCPDITNHNAKSTRSRGVLMATMRGLKITYHLLKPVYKGILI